MAKFTKYPKSGLFALEVLSNMFCNHKNLWKTLWKTF